MTNNNTSPGRFTIVSAQPEYQPLPWNELQLNTEPDLKASWGKDSTADCIYIGANAWDTIAAHIAWGRDVPSNSVEQGGLLLGRAYRNSEAGLIYGIVEKAIPAHTAEGSMAYLKIGHTTWQTMMDEIDTLTNEEVWADLQVIGWYHTHPGRLSVFMSGTDINTQQRMFSRDWQFAIVLNPQKQTWRAFRGADARECHAEIIKQVVHGNTTHSYQ
jgi:proteasome lid subunit RPN8/RPN11